MFGSKRGDSVLCEVAERLLRIAGPGALVGRLGADQFAVAMHADETTAAAVGSDMLRAMRVRVVEAERTVFLTGSVGLALTSRSEEHTSELQSLMRNSYAVFCLKQQLQSSQ